MTKYTSETSNFGSDGPFFQVIRDGLAGLVDGEDFFDLLTSDVVFEFVITVPGYPKRVEGRKNVIDLYRDYDDFMKVHSADSLRVHRDPTASVVVLEYAVHGESVQTGRPYHNRFVSIITVKGNKVTHWRDYLDPIAIFDAAGWPDVPPETNLIPHCKVGFKAPCDVPLPGQPSDTRASCSSFRAARVHFASSSSE